VLVDPKYFRPAEVDELLGDARKATRALDWRPSVSFRDLVRMMIDAELAGQGR
jgi:GDPmannose 4,6-dehydratase